MNNPEAELRGIKWNIYFRSKLRGVNQFHK